MAEVRAHGFTVPVFLIFLNTRIWQGDMQQCCQPCVFCRFRLVFCGFSVFLKTYELLEFWLVLFESCLFLDLFLADFCAADLLILWHFCCSNALQNAIWACFCVNLLIVGLFSDLSPCFCF